MIESLSQGHAGCAADGRVRSGDRLEQARGCASSRIAGNIRCSDRKGDTKLIRAVLSSRNKWNWLKLINYVVTRSACRSSVQRRSFDH